MMNRRRIRDISRERPFHDRAAHDVRGLARGEFGGLFARTARACEVGNPVLFAFVNPNDAKRRGGVSARPKEFTRRAAVWNHNTLFYHTWDVTGTGVAVQAGVAGVLP